VIVSAFFAEAAVVSYGVSSIPDPERAILEGLECVREAVAEAGCYAVVGTPTFEVDLVHNSAALYDQESEERTFS